MKQAGVVIGGAALATLNIFVTEPVVTRVNEIQQLPCVELLQVWLQKGTCEGGRCWWPSVVFTLAQPRAHPRASQPESLAAQAPVRPPAMR